MEVFNHTNGIKSGGPWLCSRKEFGVVTEQVLRSKVHGGGHEARFPRGAIVHMSSGGALEAIPMMDRRVYHQIRLE